MSSQTMYKIIYDSIKEIEEKVDSFTRNYNPLTLTVDQNTILGTTPIMTYMKCICL